MLRGSIFGDPTVVPTTDQLQTILFRSGGGDITVVGGIRFKWWWSFDDVTLNLFNSTHFYTRCNVLVSGSIDLTSLNSYTSSNDIKITNIHSTTASFDSRLDNLEGRPSGSYLTDHPNISGSNISQDNSDGTVLQDLTITLDSNGLIATITNFDPTVNLDGRYYTETESDTLFTKKGGQGVISGSSQVNTDSITNFDQNVLTKISEGIISGSSQVVLNDE